MAAVTKVAVELVSPEGYNYIIRGRATVAMDNGDPAVITSTVPPYGVDHIIAKATSGLIDGIVLAPCAANQPVEILVRGELDGYSGLTPRAKLTVVAGNIDTTAPSATATPQIVAVSDHRIAVNCLFGTAGA